MWEANNLEYTLLVGIHGVGKTTLTNELKKLLPINSLSISDLIRKSGNDIQTNEKFTKDINHNQDLWKEELKKISFDEGESVFLDGHFTLLNQEGEIIELPFSIFDGFNLNKIILKVEDPDVIRERLERRDHKAWDIELITEFQNSEIERAQYFSKLKNIPIFIYKSNLQKSNLKDFIK